MRVHSQRKLRSADGYAAASITRQRYPVREAGSTRYGVAGSAMSACTGAPCDFERDYEIAQAPLMREIEHRVRGSNYGATSWATREQVQQSAGRLSLTRGMCLLDMGAGSG